MRISITFYGTTTGGDGMPEPYHVYSIWERPAPWQGPTWKVATIYQDTAKSPMPERVNFAVEDASAGAAIQQAQQALESLPALTGLMSSRSDE
jgi:hypothetical protein